MSDTDEEVTTEDETPTPPAAGKKPVGPERVQAAHKGKQILLFNERGGPYCCSTLERLDGLTNTNQERYRVHDLQLMPGLNLVFVSLWETVSPNRRLQNKLKQGELYEVNDWKKIRLNRLYKMIKDSANVGTLETILKAEKREGVRQALIDHIAECKDTDGRAQQARRAQRAHNRRN